MKCSLQKKVFTKASILVCGVALACAGLAAVEAYAETAAEKAAEADSALAQLNAMQNTLEEKSNAYYQALAEYQDLAAQRDETQKRVDELEDEIEDIQGRLGTRVRDIYRSGSYSFIDLLLGAASFDEFAQNWDLFNRVNANDADLSERARAVKSEVQEKRDLLAKQAADAEAKSSEAGAAFHEAEELVAQMQATYDALNAEAQELYAAEQATAIEGGIQNDDGTVTDIATGMVYANVDEYCAATGNAIVDRAMAMLGHAYQYGGTGANGAFDCSGLVGYAITGSYNRIGNTTTFMGYNRVKNPKPGDICVNAGHTGIYIGHGKMIHAADEATGVVIGKVQRGMIYVRS